MTRGNPLSDEELHDELVTLLIAGHGNHRIGPILGAVLDTCPARGGRQTALRTG